MRSVNVEIEVVSVTGDEPYFICNLFRNGKKVYEAVSAHKGNVIAKALRGYEGTIKPCEFKVTERPDRSR